MVKRTGADVLAEMLQGYGVTHVFMVPSVLRRTLAEMERRTSIRRIQVHAEKAAAYMADGYARPAVAPASAWRRSWARSTSLLGCATRISPTRR